MPDGPQETPYGEPLRQQEKEPLKILPVLFILGTIAMLYLVYTFAHLVPLLQLSEPANMVDADMRFRGLAEGCVFNVITVLLLLCYIRCVLVHPGEVPNNGPWLYTQAAGSAKPPLQEAKKSGERRHCKWCGKYKPDRCHHCRVCKTCVLKMDHHCPWIYNCVGFHNYKFFFLLLFYTVLDLQFIVWTMTESMIRAIDENAPFMVMFFLLFGLTLAFFLGGLITLFWCFHTWLVLMGLSTIEFCERKYPKKEAADTQGGSCLGDCTENESPFNLGPYSNWCAVLGHNPLEWLLPFTGSPGNGLIYEVSDLPPSYPTMDFEANRGVRRKGGSSKKLLQAPPQQHYGATPAADPLQSYGLQSYGVPLFQPAGQYQRPSQGKGGGAIWGGR